VYFSLRFSIASHKQEMRNPSRRETAIENKQFKETKTLISNSYLIRQSFRGTFVNQADAEPSSVRGGEDFTAALNQKHD